MKIIKRLLLSFGFISLMLQSCTYVAYSHKDVMSRYKNKGEVIEKFGIPPIKRTQDGYEEWIYDFGNASIGNSFTTYRAGVYGGVNAIGGGSVQTYSKYVKFTFKNGGEQVYSWESQGVNYEETMRDKKATTWAWILGIGGFVGLIAGLSAADN